LQDWAKFRAARPAAGNQVLFMTNNVSTFSGSLRRFWRLPFIAGWIGAAILIKARTEQIVANASNSFDPRSGRVVRLTQDHVYYITQKEHLSLVWFGVGMAVFAISYFTGAFAAAGGTALWRLLPIDDEDLSDESRWTGIVFTSAGAAICAACIAVSCGIHWLE
jgi:hypothetical protein